MCSQRVKNRIHQSNRTLIAGLSILGFVWDGFQISDLIFIGSLLLWIWQPEWDRLEASCLDSLQRIFPGAGKLQKSEFDAWGGESVVEHW